MLCNGGEKSIQFCKSRGWGNSDCTHDEDAGVVCKDERIPGFVDSNVIDVSCQVGAFFFFCRLTWDSEFTLRESTGPHSRDVITHTHILLLSGVLSVASTGGVDLL